MPAGRPSPTPRVRRTDLGRPVLSARAGAALGVLVVLVAILAIPFREWITQRARISELESQLAWHTQRVTSLTDCARPLGRPRLRGVPGAGAPALRPAR